ncbi:phosphatidate cytidylyltransferase, photoreceptor-specific-like [Patiria miniata]|uniref:Phosphatidate cytidylyltransferase n=1 Tax=Patiria miniata TaxID=46514 RepID=A0A914AEW1_PATMI|nr:phosphatidate cytidylyltransferase, photoreceptor-specific-like [Patiria miniata]
MSELRHREGQASKESNSGGAEQQSKTEHEQTQADVTADMAEKPVTGCKPPDDLQEALPQLSDPPIPAQKDTVPSILKGLPPRWQNWFIRGGFSIVMVAAFAFIIYCGPVAITGLVLLIEMMCFHEIITIGHAVYRSQDLPWFRTLSWYFLLCANYFVYGQSMKDYFGIVLHRDLEFLQPLIDYYRFVAFWLYMFGFMLFVLSLRKSQYLVQFTLFGWTHIALLIVVTQSNLIVQSMFEGIIWFLLSTTSVICNDIMAYMFGFFFGRTSLIKLSPKKTWEGFIGACFSTVIFIVIVASFLKRYNFFACPPEFDEEKGEFVMECEPSVTFYPKEYNVPIFMQSSLALVGIQWQTFTTLPLYIHAAVIGLFASLVSPFGGFFASGFKRAFKIKDFGDVIPGHGGIMDRFDCQFLMASFLYVYLQTFLKSSYPQKLVQQIFQLSAEDQLMVYKQLTEHLNKTGILPM